MNKHDSERVCGTLDANGAFQVQDVEDADIVILLTCCVREAADTRLFGQLESMKSLPLRDSSPLSKRIFAIGGCIAQRDGEKLLEKFDYVDVIVGTQVLSKLPSMLSSAIEEGKRSVLIPEKSDEFASDLPSTREKSYSAWLPITSGCDNFCTYCIVPYVRGRERSRRPEDIVAEIKQLVSTGVIEVMLLGQNVDSYGKGLEQPASFAQLLEMVCGIDGLERVRFMTPHPKDFSDDVIEVIKNNPKICRHLHMPLQSGSTAVLKRMNRKYTKEQYLTLIDKIRRELPDASITTDIIVGFPGETEADFLDTMDVVEKAEFDSAFTFIYSKRTGTPAAKFEDQIDPDIVKDRFNRLLRLVQRISAERTALLVGQVQPVLAETINDHTDGYLTGKLANNSTVHFPGTPDMIGHILNVSLDEARGFYYIGKPL